MPQVVILRVYEGLLLALKLFRDRNGMVRA
jgi:hypothetical protein